MMTIECTETRKAIQVRADIVPGMNRGIIAKIRGHEVRMDIRKERGGDDTAPAPPEYLAAALGGCMLNLIRRMAMERGAALENLHVAIEGLIDPSLAMGLDSGSRAGFIQFSALVAADIDLSPEEQDRFVEDFERRCPLCDTIGHETPLQSEFLFRAVNREK